MDAFELTALEAERAGSGRPYFEFLRVPALSVGLYTLEAGAIDGQSPAHRGRGLRGDEPGGPGSPSATRSATSVRARSSTSPATVPHRFHDIAERLEILVVFAPAEYSARLAGPLGQPGGERGRRSASARLAETRPSRRGGRRRRRRCPASRNGATRAAHASRSASP